MLKNVSYTPVRVAGVGEQGIIVNRDLLNPVYLYNSQAFGPFSGGVIDPNASILDPRTALNTDGTRDFWAQTNNQSVTVVVDFIDHVSDWASDYPAEGSTLAYAIDPPNQFIINGGTQAAPMPNVVSVSVPLNFITAIANALSWEAFFDITTNVGVTVPFVSVDFNWFETLADAINFRQQVWTESWVMPASINNGTLLHRGFGPCRGNYLIVSTTFEDPNIANQLFFQHVRIGFSTRAAGDLSRFEGIHTANVSVPGYNASAARTGQTHLIGQWPATTIGPTIQRALLSTMNDGQVTTNLFFTGASTSYSYQPFVLFSTAAGGIEVPIGPVVTHTAPASDVQIYTVSRCPLIIRITNNDAVNSLTYQVTQVANHQ